MLTSKWTKATKSNGNGGGNCVEVRRGWDGAVRVRDSKDAGSPVLLFSPAEWAAFLDGAGRGEFDLPEGAV